MKNYFNLFGCCDKLFIILIIFIVIDYITGILKAIYNKELNSSSINCELIFSLEKDKSYVKQLILTALEDEKLTEDNVADNIIHIALDKIDI